MTRKPPSDDNLPAITPTRAARLYKLLALTAAESCPRKTLVRKLKVDVRGFYRDLELLRDLGVEVAVSAEKYTLVGELDAAAARLPAPDLGLTLRDVLALARGGSTEVHLKVQRKLSAFTAHPNGNGKHH